MTPLTFDASAVIGFLKDEPAAPAVEAELRRTDRPTQLTVVNLAEVVYRLRRDGYDETEIDQRVDDLISVGLAIVPVDRGLATHAGVLRSRHYARHRSPVSLADCVALATCLRTNSDLATSDAELIAAARAEKIGVLALP